MNRKELEKMFDENWQLDNPEETTSINENIKAFIFDTVIPEVLKSVLATTMRVDNKTEDFAEGVLYALKENRKKAKELYGIEL